MHGEGASHEYDVQAGFVARTQNVPGLSIACNAFIKTLREYRIRSTKE